MPGRVSTGSIPGSRLSVIESNSRAPNCASGNRIVPAGAGRSQVQILSPRSRESPARRGFRRSREGPNPVDGDQISRRALGVDMKRPYGSGHVYEKWGRLGVGRARRRSGSMRSTTRRARTSTTRASRYHVGGAAGSRSCRRRSRPCLLTALAACPPRTNGSPQRSTRTACASTDRSVRGVEPPCDEFVTIAVRERPAGLEGQREAAYATDAERVNSMCVTPLGDEVDSIS
jgi:hypothetical protein